MRATAAAGSATRAGWSSATRWSSRPRKRIAHARRRARGAGLRPARPAPPSSTASRATSAGSGCATTHRDSLLIDWRAPAAAVFYQATAAEPQGVVRRRVLRCAGAEGRRRRGRAARRRGRDRPADRRRGRADGAALPGPRPVDALDRRDHPGRAGQGDPRARQGRGVDLAAAPAPARRWSRCTARRTCSTPTAAATRPAACSSSARRGVFMRYIERVLPSPRRDRGRAAVARRGRRRHPGDPPRRAGGRRRQGRRRGWPS